MTATSSDGEKLVELAKDSGAFLTVGFIERFNQAVVETKKALKEKVFGIHCCLNSTERTSGRGTLPTLALLQIQQSTILILRDGYSMKNLALFSPGWAM